MPWEQKTVIEQRQEFVLLALQGGNFSALCREWGISTKTGYKWVRRFREGEELDDRSRRPKQMPGHPPDHVPFLSCLLHFRLLCHPQHRFLPPSHPDASILIRRVWFHRRSSVKKLSFSRKTAKKSSFHRFPNMVYCLQS